MPAFDWKDLSETIEHFAVAFGVLVGGVWALYTFIRLKMIDNAKLGVANAKAELDEKIKKLHESAVLEAKIGAEKISIPLAGGLHISAVATVKNLGNVTASLVFSEIQFIACEVSFDPQGTMTYTKISETFYPDPLGKNSFGTTISPKNEFQLHGVFDVKKAGLFLLMFRAVHHGEDNRALSGLINQLPRGGENTCVAHKFIAVT